ncbi:bifunctional oligoribonuclease/PAP phosphatase NrnA [Selenomonas sp. AB3002]|uniref:DHH family phosphoesterase n=1 Tax=Selenomonas sp. AB3002 TaxID=1392502 RepID=UPI000495BD96
MQIDLKDIQAQLEKADKLIITSHIHPDGDAIGSCLALYHVLKGMGKEVQVVMDDHVPEIFDILPGFGEIQRYEGQPLEADLVVLLDARPGREGRVCQAVSAPVLNIDHHAFNDMSADYAYVEPEASATAEILYGIFREWGVALTEEIASCLYLGIATDTGFFSFPNTRPETLEICANLMRGGAKSAALAAAVSRKTFHEVEELARGLGTMELFAGGKVVGIFLDESFRDLELTDALIDMVRFIDGIDLAVLLKAEDDKSCRVRLRSERLDVSGLAYALGGGGHRESAGATIREIFASAKVILKQEVCLYLGRNT